LSKFGEEEIDAALDIEAVVTKEAKERGKSI